MFTYDTASLSELLELSGFIAYRKLSTANELQGLLNIVVPVMIFVLLGDEDKLATSSFNY